VDEMGGACGTNGGKINVYIILMEKLEDKRLPRRPWIRCMVTLKWKLNKTCGLGLD
jgi:hypothetical protein